MAITRGATVSIFTSSIGATSVSDSHTVDSGTTLLFVTTSMEAGEGLDAGPPAWNTTETMTLIRATTNSGSNQDVRNNTYALVNPTATTANITYSHTSTDNMSHVAVNYLGTETSSVAAATNALNEDVNDTATSTTVLASGGAAGSTLVAVGVFKGGDGDPASNNASFNELADSSTGASTTSDTSFYVADLIGISGATAVTITWAGTDENAGQLVEIIPAAAGDVDVTANLAQWDWSPLSASVSVERSVVASLSQWDWTPLAATVDAAYIPIGEVFAETWEGAGRIATWDADTTTGSGALDDDFALSVAPNPPTWRDQGLEAETTSSGDDAYAAKTLTSSIPDAYATVSLSVDTDGLAVSANQILFSGYDSATAAASNLCFSVRLQRETTTDYRYLVSYHHSGADQFVTSGAALFERNQAFEFKIRWSPGNTACEIYIEGALIVQQNSLSTTRGDLKYFRVGIEGAPTSTRMLCGRLDIDDTAFSLPTHVKEDNSATKIWEEDFENASGTDETWTDGVQTSAGASVDTDADPSGLSGVPPDWLTEAAKFIVGATPGALIRTDWGTAYSSQVFLKTCFYLETDGLSTTNEADIDIMVGKQDHGAGENIFALQCVYTSTLGLILRFAMGTSFERGSVVIPVVEDTFYDIEIKIDFTDAVASLWVDGVLRLEVQQRSSWHQTMQWLIIGQSGSASGVNTTWWQDRVYASVVGFPVTGVEFPILAYHYNHSLRP